MVRIELPRAQLFNANTATISNDGKTLLDRVGARRQTAISRSANNSRSPCRIRPDNLMTIVSRLPINKSPALCNYLVGMTQLPAESAFTGIQG